MFRKIAVPDPNPTLEKHRELIQPYSREKIEFHSEPAETDEEIIRRCGEADAILIGPSTKLSSRVILACPDLKHIGLACTLFEGEGANVDLKTAAERSISVAGVRDYGDIGVAEWVVSEIIRHLQNRIPKRELAGRRVGIVGAGAAGGLTALALQGLGAEVSYFSRSPKPRMEEAGIERRDLTDLAAWAEFLSFHLPRNAILGGADLLSAFNGELFLNTSLGLPLVYEAVVDWLDGEGHCAAIDVDGIGNHPELKDHPSVRFLPTFCGFTEEAQRRLIDGVLANLENASNS